MLHLFQFTPLREGRRLERAAPVVIPPFQFTPLREGRLGADIVPLRCLNISIHAPT